MKTSRNLFGVWTLGLLAWVVAPEAAAFDEPVSVAPPHASSRLHTGAEAVAPLTIETPTDGKRYYIKLQSLPGCNTLTQSIGPDFVVPDCDVFDIFVQGGKTVKTTVPLGEYLVKYSRGDAWYGYKYLFGPRGGYSVAETTLDFKAEDDRLKGFSLRLYQVQGGNLRTERLDWTNF